MVDEKILKLLKIQYKLCSKYDTLDNVLNTKKRKRIYMFININSLLNKINHLEIDIYTKIVFILNVSAHYKHYFNNKLFKNTIILYNKEEIKDLDLLISIINVLYNVFYIGKIENPLILKFLIPEILEKDISKILFSSDYLDYFILNKKDFILKERKGFNLYNINNFYKTFFYKEEFNVEKGNEQRRIKFLLIFLYCLGYLENSKIKGIFKGKNLIEKKKIIEDFINDRSYSFEKVRDKSLSKNEKELKIFIDLHKNLNKDFFINKDLSNKIKRNLLEKEIKNTNSDDLVFINSCSKIELKLSWLLERLI